SLGEFVHTTHDGTPRWPWLLLIALAIVFARPHVGVAEASPMPQLVRMLRGWVSAHRWSLLVAASGVVTVVPGLIIYAKTAYLLPIVPLLWAGAGAVAVVLLPFRPVRFEATRKAMVAVAAIAVVSLVATAGRLFSNPPKGRPVLETVAILERECPR